MPWASGERSSGGMVTNGLALAQGQDPAQEKSAQLIPAVELALVTSLPHQARGPTEILATCSSAQALYPSRFGVSTSQTTEFVFFFTKFSSDTNRLMPLRCVQAQPNHHQGATVTSHPRGGLCCTAHCEHWQAATVTIPESDRPRRSVRIRKNRLSRSVESR